MTIGINLPADMIANLGFDPHWLLTALAACLVTALAIHRRMALIVIVISMVFDSKHAR